MKLRFGYSADADDAFMAWALPDDWEHVVSDIQTLNEWALEGRLELTAISAHAFPRVRDRYDLLPCGASFGMGYGPVVVAREELTRGQLQRTEIVVPGELTTAYLVLREYLGGDFAHRVLRFDAIIDEVASGRAEVGLVLHEGQLTYPSFGLALCVDLGAWWTEETGLPLPLGLVVARRDVNAASLAETLRSSIEAALANREEALAFAAQHARGLEPEVLDRFVGMYVNELSIDMGGAGRRAVEELVRLAEG